MIPDEISARYVQNMPRTEWMLGTAAVVTAVPTGPGFKMRARGGDPVNIGPVVLTPIWREALLGLELASLLRHPVYRDPPAAPESLPVMLIPGFLTGDAQLATLGSWLRRCGHRTHRSGIRLNIDCSAAATARLEGRLEEFVQVQDEPAVLIGQSRGGLFARCLAVRRPELVRAVVTLGSPHRNPLAVHPLVWYQGAVIAGLGTLGVPGLATHRCHSGSCCRAFMRDLRAPLPAGMEFLSVHSRSDGIVDWRACVERGAVNSAVRSTHCGMAVNPQVYELLHGLLHRPARSRPRVAAPRRAAA
jgi:pimeloyl-ACP methyl ester carboxylesterase